jgi:hypothetical protein
MGDPAADTVGAADTADTTGTADTAAATTVKKTPGKMTTVIGHFAPDVNQFKTLVNLGEGANDKQVNQAVLKLGPGEYDVLVYRTYKKVFKTEVKNVIN